MTKTTIRPFDAGNWFPINNAVFDHIMPELAPNAFKVLCWIIRQTRGWQADPNGDPKERKMADRISYSQFLPHTGIKSDATLTKAIRECVERGYVLRYPVGTERGKPAYIYALNVEYTLEVVTTSKNRVVTTPESEVVTTPENGDTNNNGNTIQTSSSSGDGDGNLPTDIMDGLRAISMNLTPKIRREVAAAYQADPDRIIQELQALNANLDVYDNPAGIFLTVVVRTSDGTLQPRASTDVAEQGTPDPDCPYCMGTGTPVVDGIWQHGKACQCRISQTVTKQEISS